MSNPSKTHQSKTLYEALKHKLPAGLLYHGDRWYWVANGNRCFFLEEIEDGYLERIIKALKQRHPEALREPLEKEVERRKNKRQIHVLCWVEQKGDHDYEPYRCLHEGDRVYVPFLAKGSEQAARDAIRKKLNDRIK